ncbi:hypothetical protein L843_5456 [Mycobacterium intracellulare MIN_061107_1834]|nr:hypothetical protein L843_5456 [Mycobacterium intracellulare MIN_061107_1834]
MAQRNSTRDSSADFIATPNVSGLRDSRHKPPATPSKVAGAISLAAVRKQRFLADSIADVS